MRQKSVNVKDAAERRNTMKGLALGALLLAVMFCVGPQRAAHASGVLADDFEGSHLSKNWSRSHLIANEWWLDKKVVRSGNQSLALKISKTDITKSCQCQRNEIREARSVQLDFGTDAWYSFSLKVDKGGHVPEKRWMLVSWKQDGDGSPFLALRYDRGVFYATIESSGVRVLLASSLLDARLITELLKINTNGANSQKYGFISDPQLYRGKTAIDLSYGLSPYLPDPGVDWVDLVIRVKGDLHGHGILEIYANDHLIVKALGTIGVANSTGPKQYLRIGNNRDPMALDSILYVDRFRRGPSREAVTQK